MDAEALIGRQAGTSTLQRVIGDGTLGAVYLGQQAQPARQVAVKVFLRLAALEPEQQQAFLAAFRDEMACVFALHHPHILPVYDYGDVDWLAYITMPCIAGETLEEMLARDGALPLDMVANCLQQIASALDYAHSRGVVHRDLKPATIFLTPEKKIWVADFHLTAMLVEGKTAHMRLSQPGLLDYMSPELIVGKPIDHRADLYSLGALLYRMVTGVPPFQGQTLMKVATKHIKMPPPAPREARPDLPPAAEQVILKALAKNPAQRFDTAMDMALLFQQAIARAKAPRSIAQPAVPLPFGKTRLVASDDPAPASYIASNPAPDSFTPASAGGSTDTTFSHRLSTDGTASDTGARPFASPPFFGPGWRTNAMPALRAGQNNAPGEAMNPPRSATSVELAASSSAALPSLAAFDPFAMQNGPSSLKSASQGLTLAQGAAQANPLTPPDQASAQETLIPAPLPWALPAIKQDESGTTGTLKLTGPAHIVSIPVAGQPGRYMTGILPTSQQSAETSALHVSASAKSPLRRRLRSPIFVLAVLLILCGSLGFVFVHLAMSNHSGSSHIKTAGTSNISATASAQTQETAEANTILSDTLAQNLRDWPEAASGPFLYQFKDSAYHITNNDPSRVAIAILPGENLNRPFVYTLTMDEIRGDDSSVNNESGMILRFNSQVKNGRQIITFYSFEVVNEKGGQYQFWKYDNSQGPSVNPWKLLASHPFGGEFRQGQGTDHSNTFKIQVNDKNFTLIVNGKQVWSVQDSSFSDGQVGMLVNLKGTEVAFSNLLLTWS